MAAKRLRFGALCIYEEADHDRREQAIVDPTHVATIDGRRLSWAACDLLLFNPAMSGRAAWEDAWERALPRISSLRTSLATNPIVSRVTRVGKLDSELLDQELVQLLEEPLKKAFALLNVSIA